MKDLELQKTIEELFAYSSQYPERIISQIGISLADCSRAEQFVDFVFENDRELWLNQYGGVCGGIISTVFDICMGFGATAMCMGFVSTSDLSVSYLKPMMGARYRVHIEYTQVGSRMIRCIGKAIDTGQDLLCATAQGSFVITQGKAPGSRV